MPNFFIILSLFRFHFPVLGIWHILHKEGVRTLPHPNRRR